MQEGVAIFGEEETSEQSACKLQESQSVFEQGRLSKPACIITPLRQPACIVTVRAKPAAVSKLPKTSAKHAK